MPRINSGKLLTENDEFLMTEYSEGYLLTENDEKLLTEDGDYLLWFAGEDANILWFEQEPICSSSGLSVITNTEFGIQPYRSEKSYAEQMQKATEKAVDDVTIYDSNRNVGDLLNPAGANTYPELGYEAVPPAGLSVSEKSAYDAGHELLPDLTDGFVDYWFKEKPEIKQAAWSVLGANYTASMNIFAFSINPAGIAFKSDGTKFYIGSATSPTRKVHQYSLVVAWDVASVSYDGSYSIPSATGVAGVTGISFSDDGTKMYISGTGGSYRKIYQYTLSTAWDVTTASYASLSLDCSSQMFLVKGMFLGSSGTKLYVSGEAPATGFPTIYQYTLSTPWDISTASYDSKSKNVIADTLSNYVRNLFVSPGGTKMYITVSNYGVIMQYTLSTAWDVSTATYDTEFLDVLGQESNLYGLFFKSDGTKTFIVGYGANTVFQYQLASAWDLDVAATTKDISGQSGDAQGLFFKPDGTKVYIIDYADDKIYQYSLSSAWQISTLSYDSKSFGTSAQTADPYDVSFKADGTKIYVLDTTNDTIYQYSLSPAWDVSTASYDSKSKNVSSEEAIPRKMFLKADGTKIYVGGFGGIVYQYTLSTAWDVSTAAYDSKSFDTGGNIWGIWIADDGSRAYVGGAVANSAYRYTLSTAWDISTAVYDDVYYGMPANDTGLFLDADELIVYSVNNVTDVISQKNISGYDDTSYALYAKTNPNGIYFKDDGLKTYIADPLGYILQFTNAWDIYTSYYGSKDVSAQEAAPQGLTFKPDGYKMYIVGPTNKTIYQYSLSLSWYLLLGVSYDSKSFNVSAYDVNPMALFFRDDGAMIFMAGFDTSTIYRFELSTPWDISTASFSDNYFSVVEQDMGLAGLFIKDDGYKFYITGTDNDMVLEYEMLYAWDLTSASYTGNYFDMVEQSITEPRGLFFHPDGIGMYVVDYNNSMIYQYALPPWD